MHLVCHQNIPGTAYRQGDTVTEQKAIDAVLANSGLAKNFSQVPDGTFPSSTPAPRSQSTGGSNPANLTPPSTS